MNSPPHQFRLTFLRKADTGSWGGLILNFRASVKRVHTRFVVDEVAEIVPHMIPATSERGTLPGKRAVAWFPSTLPECTANETASISSVPRVLDPNGVIPKDSCRIKAPVCPHRWRTHQRHSGRSSNIALFHSLPYSSPATSVFERGEAIWLQVLQPCVRDAALRTTHLKFRRALNALS